MGLTRLAWRTVAARPLRSLLTIVGIGLGIAVLTASLTLGDALDAGVDRTVRDMVGRADLRVSGFLESGLSDESVATIASTPGVLDSAPVIEHRTFPSGSPSGETADAVTVLGIDPGSYLRLHDLPLLSGSPLDGSSERVALVTEELAASDGYTVGSKLALLGAGGLTELRVVGILPGIGPVAGTGRTVVTPIDVASTALGLHGATRLDLRLAPESMDAVRASLEARMAEPYVLASPGDIARNLRASSAAFQGTAALVAAIVLFVGAFLIVNTLSMTVGERAREVGLLRAAGATRGQLSWFVFSGALLLGVIGAALGVGVGSVFALVMSGAVSEATGLSASISELDIAGALTAAAVGIGITVLAAIEPALAAARISPVEALRNRIDLPNVSRGRLSWIVFIFLVVAALAMLAWPPVIAASGTQRAFAIYGVLLVATLLSPFILRPLARLLGLPLQLVLRIEERLARGSLARDRSRTTLTLGSLVIGLAMVVALGWSAQAARASAFAWLEDVMPGDEIVTSIRPVEPDEPIQAELAAVPGVSRVTPIASFDMAFRGMRVDAAAVAGADLLADGRLTMLSGDRAFALRALDAGGAVILPEGLATSLGLAVGDTMHVPVDGTRSADLRVVAIVERSMPGSSGEAALVGWKDATETLGVLGADAFAVRFSPGAAAVARPALRETAQTFALEANPIERVQGAVADALSRVFGVFDALAIVAVIVAALGIVNTLTMGVVERIREIGVLRAIGMSRRQAMRMVVVEASLLGIVGVILGSLAGLGAGAALLQLAGGLAHPGGLPWLPIGVAAILGLVLPALASIYPALAAARISIVSSLYFD
ncbi:MAG TPA: FtsX-like permease family protein [Candidatus Limnocylindrales bacterium]|nr:FtsX-like permease family protein [Candidatus Limnocylindrales bacterium]